MSDTQGFPSSKAPFVSPATGALETTWYQFFLSLWKRTGAAQGGGSATSGDLKPIAGATAPAGWVICDGSQLSRTNFSNLFAAIGTSWGPGDGSTTFNIPDLRGRVLVGAGSAFPLGSVGGAASATLTIAQLPSHTHTVDDPGHTHGVTDPGHFHTALVASSTNTAGAAAGTAVSGSTSTDPTGVTVNSATTEITLENTGSGSPVATMPPYGAVTWCIKT